MTDLAATQAELEPERTATEQALAWLRDVFQVIDDDTHTWASARLLEVKARATALEDRRTAITKPLLEAKRRVDDLFTPVKSVLIQCEAVLKSKIGGFVLAREQQRRELAAKSAAEYQAGGTPTDIIPAPAQASGVSVRAVWDFEITDAAAVPRDLCAPDVRLIKARIPKDGDPPQIPGVRFFQRGQVAASRGKT